MNICVYIDSMKPAGGIERVISKLTNLWINEILWETTILTKDNEKSFYELNEKIKITSLLLDEKRRSSFKVLRALQVFF